MSKDLTKLRERWLAQYFKATAAIWVEWKAGKMSYREREETLGWYRSKLHSLNQGPKPAPILIKKPKAEDNWIESIKL
jgi:hypothetical protein